MLRVEITGFITFFALFAIFSSSEEIPPPVHDDPLAALMQIPFVADPLINLPETGFSITPTPSPTPEPEPYVAPYVEPYVAPLPVYEEPVMIASTDVESAFMSGWHDAGGGILKSDWSTWRFVNCESTWHVYTPYSAYMGLTQFSESTWAAVVAITGLGDPHNPYHMGFNTATWAHVSNPGTQWPYCWWV